MALISAHIGVSGELEVTNSKYATKLLINPTTSELDTLKSRYYWTTTTPMHLLIFDSLFLTYSSTYSTGSKKAHIPVHKASVKFLPLLIIQWKPTFCMTIGLRRWTTFEIVARYIAHMFFSMSSDSTTTALWYSGTIIILMSILPAYSYMINCWIWCTSLHLKGAFPLF